MTFLTLLLGLLITPVAAPKVELSDTSVYQLDSSWQNQDGQKRVLKDLLGKPTLVAMVFTHCKHSCPRIIADLKRVEGQLTDAQLKGMRFLLVSMDPERDTPPVLKAFAKKTDLNPQWWTLLHGAQSVVREFSAVVSVRFKKAGDGDFAHSNQLTLLNAKGEIVYVHEGQPKDMSVLFAKVKSELKVP